MFLLMSERKGQSFLPVSPLNVVTGRSSFVSNAQDTHLDGALEVTTTCIGGFTFNLLSLLEQLHLVEIGATA